jgi:hypothetical protein
VLLQLGQRKYALETKQGFAGCDQTGNPLPSVAAMVPLYQATLVRGAIGVLAPTRPASSLDSFLTLFSTAAFPVNLLLHQSQVLNVLSRPETISDCSN